MNITLIGGSGFVGTRLIALLKKKPQAYNIRNIDLEHSVFHDEITEIGDVRNLKEMEAKLKGSDLVVLLAAQHRDDVTPTSLYYDTNVSGMKNTLEAMDANGVKRLIFFSSVAVYGLNKNNPDETHPADPFNHYGKSKWQAEEILRKWHESHPDWNISVVRPTVIFGERNRGNVYNLLRQISSGRFLMIGKGTNVKSMAYVGNIVAFVEYLIENMTSGYHVFNYVDAPDMNMNELVNTVGKVLGKHIPSTHFPLWLGMTGGYVFDLASKITGKKFSVSSVRVKKFCASTKFNAEKAKSTSFKAPYTLAEGLTRTLDFEFINPPSDGIVYKSE